jgi:hypothetical protein
MLLVDYCSGGVEVVFCWSLPDLGGISFGKHIGLLIP